MHYFSLQKFQFIENLNINSISKDTTNLSIIYRNYSKTIKSMEIIKMKEFCKKKGIPNICFPKGLNKNYKDFNKLVKPSGISLDPLIDPSWAKENLKDVVLQGGLNPNILLKSE